MIENKVKLVVWDLDGTFWRGTLEEGGAERVARNIEIVRELSRRGIVNSICSKNDRAAAMAKLDEFGVRDLFVFPRIGFQPKGLAVAETIEGAALRAENVLFLDDNPSNLEEVRFFNPGIMAAHPDGVLETLLDHPNLAGQPDPELTRLKQYRLLERKHETRSASASSNEDFLRASNIRLTISHDVEADIERVVELISRANQLNYTKRRLDTADGIARFRKRLGSFGMHAATVRARDDHGDYGLVGFFLMKQRAAGRSLVHFVFSCRTMNMGIEQYVHEMLGRPEIDIVPPVAYGLASHAKIDWIRETPDGIGAENPSRSLLLLGGCDLLQLSAYCSTDRLEFVNIERSGTMVRYDDPGFILSDREATGACEALREIPSWNHADALRFDGGLESRETIILSLWSGMNGAYFKSAGGVMLRMNKPQERHCRRSFPDLFTQSFTEVPLDDAARLGLIAEALDAIASRSRGTIFLLGCNTRSGRQNGRRQAYNMAGRAWCERSGARARFLDVDGIVPAEHLIGHGHFSRAGYHALARHVLDLSAE